MEIRMIKSRLGKYYNSLAALNESEGWGWLKSIITYFDYAGAFVWHGCLMDQYVNGRFYTYRRYYRKRVITQRRLERIMKIANSPNSIHLLDNKAHFNSHFSKWVKRGWMCAESMTLEELAGLCRVSGHLFIKPIDEYEGRGIRRVESPVSEDDVVKLYSDLHQGKYIVEQELVQHPRMSFGNKSVNTIRINTLLDRNGDVHFFKPVLRVGIGDSYVDNYNAGGVEYAVDLESGVIVMPGYCKGKLTQIYHPGTDIRMVGYQIPSWSKVLESVTEAARHIPQCRYVGWDVAITPDGIELIEGNHNPGYVCMEYFGETGWYEKLKKYL